MPSGISVTFQDFKEDFRILTDFKCDFRILKGVLDTAKSTHYNTDLC